MKVCSPTSESLGCDSSANGPSVLPCHVCCSRVGSSHGSVKRDRVRCPHAWSVRSYGELAVAFVPTGTCITWQGFSRVIRCYAYGDRCFMACLDGSGLASLEAWVGFVQSLLYVYGAPPHRISWLASRRAHVHVLAAADRDASNRFPLWWPRVARTRERDMEATERPPGE
jgi:hypothetical protein